MTKNFDFVIIDLPFNQILFNYFTYKYKIYFYPNIDLKTFNC